MEMDIQDFLGTNYCDLFDPPECIFDLRDTLNNDWLENIFSSSSSSASASPPMMTGMDDLLPGSSSPDSVQYEHSYSMGSSCDSSPSGDSWTRTEEEREDPFDFLRDIGHPNFDITTCILQEKEHEAVHGSCVTAVDDRDEDLDRWMQQGSPSSSTSSSTGIQEVTTPVTSPPVMKFKKNVILFTGEDGQTIRFTPEEPNNNNNNSSSNDDDDDEEVILVDWSYDTQNKDPLDLSICKGKVVSSSEGAKSCDTIVYQTVNSPPLSLISFSSQWKNEDHHALRSFTLTEALFSNPVPREGLLMLTDEEKNTLVAEGYPIPTKLPLGKAEEKYLKKIRRKIKNKISAQESRRKKKEYMDQLELKMHKYYQENADLLKKVERLENNNRLLLVQLQNAQKIIKKTATSAGGTTLMVLVLFFAAFLGSWSPISWSIGYGRTPAVDRLALPSVAASCGLPVGPDLQHPMVGVYRNLRGKSRLLMSTKDEDEALNNTSAFGPTVPASYMNTLTFWFSSVTQMSTGKKEEDKQAEAEDIGFSVRQILPLTQPSLVDKKVQPVSNETFIGHFPNCFIPNIGQIKKIETIET